MDTLFSSESVSVFSGNAYHDLLAAGAVRVITCNTIKHETNTIDLSETIVEELKKFLRV